MKSNQRNRGFTLMEVLVAILVIFMLMGLLIVGINQVRKAGKGARDVAMATSLKQGITMFVSEVGFLPPMVNETHPNGAIDTTGIPNKPRVYSASSQVDATFLRTRPAPHLVYATLDSGTPYINNDQRFSLFTVPYYVIGALEATTGETPDRLIDGVPGPGFFKPKRDGTFEKAGRKFDSFFDLSKNGTALVTMDAAAGKVVLRDANGVPVRFYRWLRGDPQNGNRIQSPDDCCVPLMVGRADQNPALKTAEYAIVLAGPDGVFGDEADLSAPTTVPQTMLSGMVSMSWSQLASKVGLPEPQNDQEKQRIRDRAMKDNIVEYGSAK